MFIHTTNKYQFVFISVLVAMGALTPFLTLNNIDDVIDRQRGQACRLGFCKHGTGCTRFNSSRAEVSLPAKETQTAYRVGPSVTGQRHTTAPGSGWMTSVELKFSLRKLLQKQLYLYAAFQGFSWIIYYHMKLISGNFNS